MTHAPASAFVSLLGLALVVVTSGCRTYGDDYRNEEAMLKQIVEANEQFADELARARTDLVVLRRAAAANPVLEPLVERYAGLLVAHEVVLEVHRDMAIKLDVDDSIWAQTLGGWIGDGDYRPLHRAYGAIISEQQIVRDRYDALLENVVVTPIQDSLNYVWALEPYPEGRYYVIPPQYERMRNLGAYTSMRRALRQGALPGDQE